MLVCLAVAGAFAVTPEYFIFEVGAMESYEIEDGTVSSVNPFGIQFQFDDAFFADCFCFPTPSRRKS